MADPIVDPRQRAQDAARGIIEPHEIPYNDPNLEYVDDNPWGRLKTSSKDNVRTLANPLDEDFIHAWNSVDEIVPARSVRPFPEAKALHLAKHLARKIYYEPYFAKWLPHERQATSVPESTIVEVASHLLDRDDINEVIEEIKTIREGASRMATDSQAALLKSRQMQGETAKSRQEAEQLALEAKRQARGEDEFGAPLEKPLGSDAETDVPEEPPVDLPPAPPLPPEVNPKNTVDNLVKEIPYDPTESHDQWQKKARAAGYTWSIIEKAWKAQKLLRS